ncbi:hypothetical protein DICA1_F04786 [Diutina catenulata]
MQILRKQLSQDPIDAIAVFDDGRVLAACGYKVWVVDMVLDTKVEVLESSHRVVALAISPNQQQVAVASGFHIESFDIGDWEFGVIRRCRGVLDVSYLGDTFLVAATSSHKLIVYDLNSTSQAPLSQYDAGDDNLNSVAVYEASVYLGSSNGDVYELATASQKLWCDARRHDDPVLSVAAPSGPGDAVLASTRASGTTEVCSYHEGKATVVAEHKEAIPFEYQIRSAVREDRTVFIGSETGKLVSIAPGVPVVSHIPISSGNVVNQVACAKQVVAAGTADGWIVVIPDIPMAS